MLLLAAKALIGDGVIAVHLLSQLGDSSAKVGREGRATGNSVGDKGGVGGILYSVVDD